MRRRAPICAAICALCCGLLLGGCTTHPAPPVSFHYLRLARSFKPIAIYWVGRTFGGVPLTAIDDGSDYSPTLGMTAYYGDCRQASSPLRGGCTLPLRITSVIYTPHGNDVLLPYRSLTIRGVPAIAYDRGRSLELYTGYLAIDVTADTPARALAAARLLTPLNEPAPLVGGDRLPPPDYTPGLPKDPRARELATALRNLGGTDTTLSILKPGRPLP